MHHKCVKSLFSSAVSIFFIQHTKKTLLLTVKSFPTVKGADIVGGVEQRHNGGFSCLSSEGADTGGKKICVAGKDSTLVITIQDGSEKAETSGALERSRFTLQVNFPCITSKLGQME